MKLRRNNQKGFGIAELGLVVGVAIIVVISAYLVLNKKVAPLEVSNPSIEPIYQGIAPVVHADWKTYTNKKFGFEFKYPKDWRAVENLNPRAIMELYTPKGAEAIDCWAKQGATGPGGTSNCLNVPSAIFLFEDAKVVDINDQLEKLNRPKAKYVTINALQWLRYYDTTQPPYLAYHINVPNKDFGLLFRAQADSNGKDVYEQTLIQILSTFRFTK